MSNIGDVRDGTTMTACGHCGAAVEPRDLTDIGCILCGPDDAGFPVLTEEQLEDMLADPAIAYDAAAVDEILDEIVRLQGDDDETPRATWDEGCDDAA